MRIDAYNQINQIYKISEKVSVKQVGKTSQSDSLELSQLGKDYQIAKKALANTPDIRQDKVDDVKKRMENGTYNVSNDDFAEKLLESFKKLGSE